MQIPLYIIDAFTSSIFKGNPAAVCPLKTWLPDRTLQSIALENNLSETAFFIPCETGFKIRWFTPSVEVDLCGHATLATAFVFFSFISPASSEVLFESKSGQLGVQKTGELLSLDFPSRPGALVEAPRALIDGMGVCPLETFLARDYLMILKSEQEVRSCQPKFELLQNLPSFGIVVSAPGSDCDFVSRAFFPTDAILEDPVTGSTHCTLVPYWARRLEKEQLHAKQLSKRAGELFCAYRGSRVTISGKAVLYARGEITVPDEYSASQ